MFLLAAYLGLRDVFSDYSRLSAPESPTSRILPYYATVSASLGASLVPPQRVVRDVLDDAVMEGNGAIAREAYDLLVSGYGAPADGSELTARISDLEKLPPPAETVEGLLATPFPTADELRPYLGDWVGDQWMKPEQPRTHRLTLRFRVEAGKAIGELLDPEAPPDSRLRRVDYLRVTPTGLTYGIMNGMRPRGVVLYEGTLSGGDTLSGKSRFGGIRFEYPPEARVDPGFAFRRVIK